MTTFLKKILSQTPAAMQAFQVMRQLAAVAVSIGLAKSALPLAEIGSWEQMLFLGTTLSFFWVNGLMHGLLPTYPKLDDDGRKSLVFNSFLLFNSLAAALFLLLFWGKTWLVPALTGQPDLPHFGLFAAWLCLGLPCYPVEHFFLLKERPTAILGWGVASFGGMVACAVAPVWLGFGLRGALVALTVFTAARWFFSAWVVFNWGKINFDKPLISNYLRISAPLTLNQIAGSLVLLVDGWLVGWWFRDDSVFAIWRYGAREFPLALALATGLSTAMAPRLAADLPSGLDELKRRNRRLMHLTFPAVIALLLFSGRLFQLVFRPDFAASAPVFNLFLLISASRMVLTYPAMLALGEGRAVLWITAVELAVKLSLGLLFIKVWGLPGLALANVLAFWVEKLGQLIFLWKKHGIRPAEFMDWRLFLAYSAAMLAAWLLS